MVLTVINVSPENWLAFCLPLPFTTLLMHTPCLRSSDTGWGRMGCWEGFLACNKQGLTPWSQVFILMLAKGQQMTPMQWQKPLKHREEEWLSVRENMWPRSPKTAGNCTQSQKNCRLPILFSSRKIKNAMHTLFPPTFILWVILWVNTSSCWLPRFPCVCPDDFLFKTSTLKFLYHVSKIILPKAKWLRL